MEDRTSSALKVGSAGVPQALRSNMLASISIKNLFMFSYDSPLMTSSLERNPL